MKFNKNIFGWVATVLLVVSIIFNIQQNIKNNKLEKFQTDSFEELKIEKQNVINEQNLKIDSLIINNQIKDEVIANSTKNYDSLQGTKDKVRIIYKDRYKEVEGFDADNIVKYWGDEFD